jgi:Ca2+-binding RTX toxin-like protein
VRRAAIFRPSESPDGWKEQPMFTTARLVAAVATVAALAGPAGASATTCTYTPANDRVVLALTAPAPNGVTTLSRSGNAIVWKNGPTTAAVQGCGGASVTNTQRIIVTGTAQADHLVVELTNGLFVPGTIAEAVGASEIETLIDLIGPPGQDTVEIVGSARDDLLVAGRQNPGRQQVAFNSDNDEDITIDGRVDELTLRGLAGNDLLLGRGGFGVRSPYGDTLRLAGGTGNDVLLGSEGDDDLAGGPDADILFAFGGVDRINAQDGIAEVVDTGAGADNVLQDATDTVL